MAPLSEGPVTRIYLIRHGETDWNRVGLYQGTTDVPLNHRGREQARVVARSLACVRFAAVYTSPLGRARETADVIMGGREMSVIVLPELREICYGLWQGKSFQWLQRTWPAFAHRWRSEPWTVRFPGGETLAELRARVSGVLRRILAVHPGETVLVCGHGHVNRLLLMELAHRPPDDFWKIEQPNGGCTVVRA